MERTKTGSLGLQVDRVAQIITDVDGSSGLRGSGYLVRTRMVLTAAHVVPPSAKVRVRFVADDGTPHEVAGEVVFRDETVDLAVIRLDAGPEVPPVTYGRIQESLPIETIGFPRFRLHSSTNKDGKQITFRDTRHARGVANPASWLREGGLEIIVDPPACDPDPKRSPWEGMSGAAIWSVGHLVGIVFEHRPGDALNTLTGSRVDRWYTELRLKRRKRLHDLIGLPLEHSRLVTVTPQVMRLYAYLDAGIRMADEDPQAVVFAGRPKLSKIYTAQSIRQQGLPDFSDIHITREVSPPDTILDLDGNIVVVAGPGGGKSSLLNWLMMAGIDRWRLGNPRAEVPIVVQAADLADDTPLSAALAASVSRSLARFGLLDPLPAEFFQEPPSPSGRWLLLVDSLDEIIDAEMRRGVLKTVASIASTAHRFVICTRPLPGDELELLGAHFPRYELLPFSAADVGKLGEYWFTTAGAADPAELVRSFTTAIEQAGISELARTPLMATMLCQLHIANQGIPFPSGRSKIFDQFTALLSERFHSRGPGGIYAQARAALERYGPGVVTKAEASIECIPDVIEELAARQNEDAGLTTREFITTHPGLGRPEPVTATIWDEFVHGALRRTGLVIGSDLRFFHHTLMEYLSAQHIAKDEMAYAAALHEGLRAVDRRLRTTAFMSVPAAAPEASYLGFLLDVGEPPRAALKLLDGMAGSRDIQGCEFIADLARLGTALPPVTARKAYKALWKRLHRKWRYTTADQGRAVIALAGTRPRPGNRTHSRDVAEPGKSSDAQKESRWQGKMDRSVSSP